MIVLANYEVAGVDQYDDSPVSLDDISELNSWCHEAEKETLPIRI